MNNREKILLALSFLITVSGALSAELQGLIQPRPNNGNGKSEIGANLKRHTVYVRKEATNASSRWAIIDENTSKVDGVSSISKTSLPKNEAVVFDKIAIGFGEGDAAGLEGAINYSANTAPAALRNAVFVITQNGREVVEIPVSEALKGVSPGSPADYYHDLEGFHYLVDDQPMEWMLRFPNGQTLAPSAIGKFVYVEFRLQGFKTARKQK